MCAPHTATSSGRQSSRRAGRVCGVVVTEAPLVGGDIGPDVGDMLAAAGPGGSAAARTRDGVAHGGFSRTRSGGRFADFEGIGELAECLVSAGTVDGCWCAMHDEGDADGLGGLLAGGTGARGGLAV
jgi:hypothetical protein